MNYYGHDNKTNQRETHTHLRTYYNNTKKKTPAFSDRTEKLKNKIF